MRHERLSRRSTTAHSIGWVSNTEAVLVCLIGTLATTLLIAVRLQQVVKLNHKRQDDINVLQGQVAEHRGRAAGFETERNQVAKTRQQRIDELTAMLGSLEIDHRESMAAASRAIEKQEHLEAYNKRLRANLATWRESYLANQNALNDSAAANRDTAVRLVSATVERDQAQRELTSLRSRLEAEPGLHRKLIGLKGRMQRVVIVFDTSGSMSRDGRWEHARNVVATWLEHLAISECALVLFSSDARVFPQDGSFLDVRGIEGAANRRRLLDQIKGAKPEGGTNTLLALQTAYRCQNVDSVILFTDGEPNSNSNQFDPAVAEKIYTLCQQHKDIPVNTVGLGNYFQPQLSGFLMRVAQETGGNFLGR